MKTTLSRSFNLDRVSALISGRAGWRMLLIIFCLMEVSVVRGQINDTCAGAIILQSGIPITNNMATATTNGDPIVSCVGSRPRGLWYPGRRAWAWNNDGQTHVPVDLWGLVAIEPCFGRK